MFFRNRTAPRTQTVGVVVDKQNRFRSFCPAAPAQADHPATGQVGSEQWCGGGFLGQLTFGAGAGILGRGPGIRTFFATSDNIL